MNRPGFGLVLLLVVCVFLSILCRISCFHVKLPISQSFTSSAPLRTMMVSTDAGLNENLDILSLKKLDPIGTSALSLSQSPTCLSVLLLGALSIAFNKAYLPFVFVYAFTLKWGIPMARIGSWKSLTSNFHRIGGVLTLLLPIFLVGYEAVISTDVSTPCYLLCVACILTNVLAGAKLIPRRIPAYDIPTLRAFGVGTSLAISFLTLSMFFKFGAFPWYEPIGKVLTITALYSTLYAWIDATRHMYNYFVTKKYKPEIGSKWGLPFESASFKHVFVDCLYKQPTEDALDQSVSPANAVTVLTTVLTALFASISLLQMRYLFEGSAGMARMSVLYPEIVRFSVYEALLAVVANNFGTFSGTLVIQNKVDQTSGGIYNAIGLLIPVLNLVGFLSRYPGIGSQFLATSFARFV